MRGERMSKYLLFTVQTLKANNYLINTPIEVVLSSVNTIDGERV